MIQEPGRSNTGTAGNASNGGASGASRSLAARHFITNAPIQGDGVQFEDHTEGLLDAVFSNRARPEKLEGPPTEVDAGSRRVEPGGSCGTSSG